MEICKHISLLYFVKWNLNPNFIYKTRVAKHQAFFQMSPCNIYFKKIKLSEIQTMLSYTGQAEKDIS